MELVRGGAEAEGRTGFWVMESRGSDCEKVASFNQVDLLKEGGGQVRLITLIAVSRGGREMT